MKIKTLKSESKLLGGKVLCVSDWKDIHEITSKNDWLIEKYNPLYVFCEIDGTDLSAIHKLEKAGYHFSEFRVHSILKTADSDSGVSSFFPFVAEIISEKKDLDEAIEILLATDDDDRFSHDPLIGKTISKKRVVNNLKKSFRSYPNEFLLGVFHSQTRELVAFRSGAIISKNEAHYFQYGVAKERAFDHTATMLESLTIDYLKSKGIAIIHAISTGFNIGEINRLVLFHSFNIVSSTVLMRRLFDEQ